MSTMYSYYRILPYMIYVSHQHQQTNNNMQFKGPFSHLDALRALYSRKKCFRVVENRCLQRVESFLVNLPQFAKFGLKESLNRCFWYFSLPLSGYFGLVSSLFVSVSVCFTAVPSMAAPSKRTVGRPHRLGSPKYIRLRGSVFLISGEMGKKLLAANFTDSVFAEFLLLMFNCKQRSR